MAYLDNSVITVDAVLTKKGRERLGQGRDAFRITKFAVSDDEVDYSLYNTAHPLGSNYFANIIESMPVLEAIPDESQVMRYKLVTLQDANGISRIPQIDLGGIGESVTLTFGAGAPLTLRPETFTITSTGTDTSFDQNAGYTLILFDEEAANVTVPAAQRPQGAANYTAPPTTDTDPLINFSSTTVQAGFEFVISPKNVSTQRNTKIRIYGNETGATTTITLTVNPASTT